MVYSSIHKVEVVEVNKMTFMVMKQEKLFVEVRNKSNRIAIEVFIHKKSYVKDLKLGP